MRIAVFLAVCTLALSFIVNNLHVNFFEEAKKLMSTPSQFIISQEGARVFWNLGVHSFDALFSRIIDKAKN